MRTEVLKNVGGLILNSDNIGTCNFICHKDSYGFKSSVKNNNIHDYSLESSFFTKHGSVTSCIGDNKPVLVFRPNLDEDFLELSFNFKESLQLDAKFAHPVMIYNIPFRVCAECVNNKSRLSAEFSKNFSYSNLLKGLLFVKYGKSLDFNVDIFCPYIESHFLIDSSKILLNNSFGIHGKSSAPFQNNFIFSKHLSSLFLTYQFSSDYVSNDHIVGLYTETKSNRRILSILYNLSKREISLKTEAKTDYNVNLAASADIKIIKKICGEDEEEDDEEEDLNVGKRRFYLTRFNVGSSFCLKNLKFGPKFNLKLSFPCYETSTKMNVRLNENLLADASAKYNFSEKSFGFGIDLIYNSNE